MANKKKTFGKKRQWLNPKDGVAAASYEVEVNHDFTHKQHWPSLEQEANLELSDCSRKINLEFNVWFTDDKADNLRQVKDRRAKLKRLQDVISGFVNATNASYDYIEANLDEYHAARDAFGANRKKKKK